MDAPTVANGLPALGLGTYKNTGEQATESVRTALEMGYRHIDTAAYYENEAAVGAGIAASSVPRDEVVVATKLWYDQLAGDDVIPAAKASLDRLGLEYVDVLYVHWPAGSYDARETMGAFNELYDEELVENVAVSNFTPEQLATAQDHSGAPIVANQVECHPLLQQDELRAYCEDEDIAVVAYAPIARGRVADVPELTDIAAKHDVSEVQVALAWLRQNGVAAIPKATSEAHIRENWASQRLTLDDGDVERIDSLDYNERLIDPGFAAW